MLQILSQLAELATQRKVSRVAVICCGPQVLVEEAKRACRAQNDFSTGAGVSFDFHEEVFEY